MADDWDHGYFRRSEQVCPPSDADKYPTTGARVRFVRGGYDAEFNAAAEIFDPDRTYVVRDFKLGSIRSAVRIHGVDRWFNSVMFERMPTDA